MSKLILEPLGDRVLIRPDDQEEKTKGGIYLAPATQEKPSHGTGLRSRCR